MGCYAYCHKCDAGMNKPTIREAICNTWTCGSCWSEHAVDDSVRADILEELEERLCNIEQQLGITS